MKRINSYLTVYYYHIILLLFTITLAASLAGQDNYELVGTRKLTVADFKGPPDESANYLAQTTPSISLIYSNPVSCSERGKVKVKAETAVSISDKSWIKIRKLRNPELLNALLSHEQGHYDMGLIFSIELKRKFSELCFDKINYKMQADSVFKLMYSRYDAMQKEYDAATDHMRNSNVQLQWKQKIAAMWKKLQ